MEAKVLSDVLEKRRKRRGDDYDILDDDGDNAPTLKYKAYVCDFGISRLLPLMANTLKTSTAHVNAGTANYMAPNCLPDTTRVRRKQMFSRSATSHTNAPTGRIPLRSACTFASRSSSAWKISEAKFCWKIKFARMFAN